MPTIIADDTDGVVYNDQNAAGSTAGWADCRGASTGNNVKNSIIYTTAGVFVKKWSNAGSGQFAIRRSFFAFDTSGVGTTDDNCAASATLKIHGRTHPQSGDNPADILAVKATAPNLVTGVALGDFNALAGWNSSFTSSDLTAYSSEFTSWSVDAYNTITLNAAALSDMSNNDIFQVALIEYDYDYLGVEYNPGTNGEVAAGMYYNHASSLADGKRPEIVYVEGTCGYGHDVIGVSSANIDKVIGVSTANIDKVVGV